MKTIHHKSTLSQSFIKELLNVTKAPCLSLYVPTHRTHPDNAQDVPRFKKLVKTLETSLLLKYSAKETNSILEPFEALSEDKMFWRHTLNGLGVFATNTDVYTVYLNQPVEELAIVADSFHTKPLRKYLQSNYNYHVLGITRDDVHMFEGNRYGLSKIEFGTEFPTTIKEALGSELTEKHLTVASYGGVTGSSNSMRHGQGAKTDELDKDTERFFRVVANAVHETYSKPTGLPVVLVALPEYHHTFNKVNKNPLLKSEGVTINPTALSEKELADLVWKHMEPDYITLQNTWADAFHQARANGKASEIIDDVAVAIVEGRVETLLIEQDKIIPMRLTNLTTGNVQNKDINNPRIDDLLDDMSELVTKMGGNVMVLTPDKMPSTTGLAAIFRY